MRHIVMTSVRQMSPCVNSFFLWLTVDKEKSGKLLLKSDR